jgi:hypothetical protein
MEQTSIQVGAIAGIVSLLVHTVQQVLTIVNHKRIKSQCCGKDIGDTVIDVSDITPK